MSPPFWGRLLAMTVVVVTQSHRLQLPHKLEFAHLVRKEMALLFKSRARVCLLDYRAALAFSTTAAKAAAS